MTDSNATYTRNIICNHPDYQDGTITFELLSYFAAAGNEGFPKKDYSLTLTAGLGTIALPTPDNTGDASWAWRVTTPDKQRYDAGGDGITLAYGSDLQLTAWLSAAQSTATPNTLLDTFALKAGISAAADGEILQSDGDQAEGSGYLSPTSLRKHNFTAVTAPGVGDDSADGYEAGSYWVDTVGQAVYFCVDATEAAAVWVDLTGGGGGAVDSVFGRTGAVVAAASDYDANQVDVTPAGGMSSTDVQAALEELDDYIQALGLSIPLDFVDLNDTPASISPNTLMWGSPLGSALLEKTAAESLTLLGAAASGHTHSYQPLDGELTAIAGLTSAADKLPYFTGIGTAALADLSSFGRSLIDDSDAATARTTLGLVAGGAGDIWVEKAGDTMTGPLVLPNGSSGAPALRFTTGSDDGFFQPADSEIGVAILGIQKFSFTHTGGDAIFGLPSGGRLHWHSGTAAAGAVQAIVYGAGGLLQTQHFLTTTNSVADILTVRHFTTGTPAAGFGTALVMLGESSSANDRNMARFYTEWQTATDASRVSDVIISAAYSGGWSEVIRGRGGASPLIGFLGASPVARQAHIADSAGDDATAVNAILDVLEAFGLVATS